MTRAVQLTQADAGAIYRYRTLLRNLFQLAEGMRSKRTWKRKIFYRIKLDDTVLGLASQEDQRFRFGM